MIYWILRQIHVRVMHIVLVMFNQLLAEFLSFEYLRLGTMQAGSNKYFGAHCCAIIYRKSPVP